MAKEAQLEWNVAELRGRPLGRVLVKMGKVSRDHVHEALEIQKEKGGPLGQILIDLGHIDAKDLTFALAFQAGMEYVDLERVEIPDEVIKQIPPQMANAYKVLPLEFDSANRHMVVALGSADNFRATDDLRTLMGFRVTAKIADPEKLEKALQRNCFDDMIALEIEPHLGSRKPLFLYDYPACFASLARRKPGNPDVAERFELYIRGIELCNAFSELNDPLEQRMRFEAEQEQRRASGKQRCPMPEKFLTSLSHMPPATGNALGIDRLIMLLTDAPDIEDVVAFTPETL